MERDQVDCKLPEVGVQLTREAEAGSNITHCCRNRRVPMPDPVRPPKEWQTWNPVSRANKDILLFTDPNGNADAEQKYAVNCKQWFTG